MRLGSHTKKEIDQIWNDWKQTGGRYLMLTGGVGVGKTLYAKILSNRITNSCMRCNSRYCVYSYFSDIRNNDKIELFSFGSHYSRENFIYGLSVDSENGKLLFSEVKQRVIKICERATNDPTPNNYYAVIFDDINRSDISQTLGDMLSAMESKDVGNEIRVGDERITIPDNLYIIATANPLIGKDKLDYAWMRRFMHYNILPDERHFGFDFDGADVGDGYKKKIDEEWNNVYYYDDKKFEWEHNNYEFNYNDENGEINDTGIAFLRHYQWDIFMHIKIMYERYFYDPSDKDRRDQHMPGHGMFLICFENESYGCNLLNFNHVLRYQIVPLLWKNMADGFLTSEALLDIEAVADNAGEKIEKTINTDGVELQAKGRSENAEKETKTRELIKKYESIKWSEWYLFIACNIGLRRLDRGMTPEPKSMEITKGSRWSYLIERRKFKDMVYSVYSASNKLPCHNGKQSFWIDDNELFFPQQVTNNREYFLFKKETEGILWDGITRILSYTVVEIKERNKQMSNSDAKKTYTQIMDDLNIRQMILQGPPGTSKTYGAKYKIIGPALFENWPDDLEKQKKLLEESMIKDYDDSLKEKVHVNEEDINCEGGWDMVQFHPSYCYEDFVRGISVSTNGNKQVVYETINKVLGKMCNLALKYKESGKEFFLIIDEINRADIATVFGELIYALECRNEEVSIPYAVKAEDGKLSYKLKIPDNLYIIGTMNTADKSIGTIDYAIRRRFLFFDCQPDEELVAAYIKDEKIKQAAVNMMNNLRSFIDLTINKNYHAKDLYIGHTYFLVDSEKKLELRLQYQILPILREYYENGILTGVDAIGYTKWWEKCGDVEEFKNRKNVLKEYLMGKEIDNDSLQGLYKVLIYPQKKEEANED